MVIGSYRDASWLVEKCVIDSLINPIIIFTYLFIQQSEILSDNTEKFCFFLELWNSEKITRICGFNKNENLGDGIGVDPGLVQ